jgi:hypothetical protein
MPRSFYYGTKDAPRRERGVRSSVLRVVAWAISLSSVVAAQGVPSDVMARIRSSIETRYPDDYSMQKVLIEDQVDSYQFLQTYKPGEVPDDVFSRVKASVESRYPDNYSMQKTLIEDQIESFKVLRTYNPAGVPRDVLEKIKAAIVSRYPDNYSMQKTLIEDQVNSYRSLNQ